MKFVKDGCFYDNVHFALVGVCMGRPCSDCPIYPRKGTNEDCETWAWRNKEEFARLFDMEVIREDPMYEATVIAAKRAQETYEKLMAEQEAKADGGKQRPLLVPTSLLRAVMAVREYGCQKYHDPDNWKRVDAERYKNAAYRHWLAYLDGEKNDEESGLPHLWHLACNIAFLIEMEREADGRVCGETAAS